MVRIVSHEAIVDAGTEDLQVVEVMAAEEFERIHIAGAMSIPLQIMNPDTTEQLDPGKPVVVYCWDAY